MWNPQLQVSVYHREVGGCFPTFLCIYEYLGLVFKRAEESMEIKIVFRFKNTRYCSSLRPSNAN